MDFNHQELLALIIKNQQAIADLKVLIIESKEELRNWFLLTALAAVPVVVFLHGYLHPIEYGKLEKKARQQSKTLDQMIKETRKLQEEVGTLPKTH